MLFDNVSIVSVACEDAPHRVTSSEIEEQLAPLMDKFGVQRGLFEGLTGIKSRYFWDENVQPSQMATWAGEKAIIRSGIDRSRIGVLINTSVCKDYIEPSVACIVHNNLHLSPYCINFDVGNACLAFLNGMQIAGNMIERGQIDYGLVVNGEGSRFVIEQTIKRLLNSSPTVDEFRESFATFTIGSGSVAMILGRSDLVEEGSQFRGGVTVAATEHNHLCRAQPDQMMTDAHALLVAGLGLAARTLNKANEVLGWDFLNLDHYIMHQVSKAHTEKVCESLKMDLRKVYTTYPEYGNIGPAALPVTLAKALDAGRIEKGDHIALMGIGSGLNCSMMEVVW
ncbi:3-oxoacyl-ACP synthase III [bacterium]|nr:3-oxoacyl-ACP synthase III [bacterium]